MKLRNIPAATIEMKPLHVTKEVYTGYLVDKCFPVILQNLPLRRYEAVMIHHTNARPHISPNVHQTHPLKIIFQPPNSPDWYVLNFTYFNTIRSVK